MATSGSYDFNLTRNEIIELALLKVGALAAGNTPTNEQYDYCSKFLNAMINNWRADNIFIWDLDWITIPLTASDVVLGTDGNDYECIRNHTSSSVNRPITGAQWASYWKEVNTSVGVLWVTATAYESICNVDLDSNVVGISDFKIRLTGGSTQAMTQLSLLDYSSLANTSNAPGPPTQMLFFRQPTSKVFFYPYPDSTEYTFEGYVYRYPEDFDTGADTPDLLREWLLPLVDNLAYLIAPIQGIFGDQLKDLRAMAYESKESARKLDHESGNIKVGPALYNRGPY